VSLSLDELEAIRLADYEGLYQEEAAARMKISRQTLGRILNLAHRKVAEALIQGKALKIETNEIPTKDIT
jgi:Predicted DNA-binding proteins